MTLTDPRALEVWERIADSLATIAATLTNPTARTADLTDPNRCDPGCVRPSLHGGDCSPAEANEYAPGGWASEPHHEWRPGRHITEGMTVRIIGADGSTRVGTVGEVTEADGLTSWDDCERPADPLDTVEQAAVHVVVTNRKTGATLFDGDLAKLPADLDLPQGGWSADDLVQPMADPMDESDHRDRHFPDGEHLRWVETCGGWHLDDVTPCPYPHEGTDRTLAAWEGPLSFCECKAPRYCPAPKPGYHCIRTTHDDTRPHTWTPDEEPGGDPLDESDHRPRHDGYGGHWTWRQADRWCDANCDCTEGGWVLSELDGWCGDEFTFCDCDHPDETIEAENGATD